MNFDIKIDANRDGLITIGLMLLIAFVIGTLI
jgi:hypothetical protein